MTDNDQPLCPLVKEGGDVLVCPAGLAVPLGTVLARRTLRSVAALVVVAILLTGVNLLWTAHEVRSSHAAQQQQGQLVEQKLCSTLRNLAALSPPAGSPQANPSRAFEQELHATLDELGPDLGCPS